MTTDLTPRKKTWALGLLVAAQFLIVIDSAVVNVALPSMEEDLDFSPHGLTWVVNAYTLTLGGFLLLGGRLADRLGRRRMFCLGLGLFTLASLFGGMAQTDIWLIATRAVQGIGAAIVSPAAMSLLATTFREGAERNRAFAIWGAANGAGGAAGVLLGGVLTEGLGWRWVLFINVPIGVVAVLMAFSMLMESKEDQAPGFDFSGAVAVTAGLALLVYGLVDAQNAGWSSGQTIGCLAGGVLLLIVFVAIQARTRSPLMPLTIFRLRTLRGANAVAVLANMGLLAMFFFLALYLQQVLHYSALASGVAYLPLTAGILIAANVAGRLTTKIGLKATLSTGLIVLALGFLWFAQLRGAGGSYVGDVLGPCIVSGVGFGLSVVPITIAAVSGTRPEEAGLASGLVNTAQQVGGALGLGILDAVAVARTSSVTSGGEHRTEVALTEGYTMGFYVSVGFVLLALVAALTLIGGRERDEAESVVQDEPAGAASPTA
ncbi:DHA2 family efflux MFS transporter permease subunit [Streptomyces sp. I05A-00742]|uniref:DHA2 family efflux MFS transporter permease subunit n=1 Tax=Streptomyces sp. I05A-00742 TaxID=2732853 RepID=UPI001489852B|nr:DHA2 family efflux MFS transporter permease subunit [Streptomyces sp. I05A-00742]